MSTAIFGGETPDGRNLYLGHVPDVGRLLAGQRGRLIERLRALGESGWHQPTRCHLWDVADVVAHVAHTNRWMLQRFAHAADPSVPLPFLSGAFDPRNTPHDLVVAERGRPPSEILDELEVSTELVATALSATEPAWSLLPWVAGLRYRPFLGGLHLLWDSWLHERDLLLPLGLGGDHPEDELAAVAHYGVFLPAVIASLGRWTESSLTVDVHLWDRTDRWMRLDIGGAITLGPLPTDAPPASLVLEGPTIATVEALTGRGDLDDVATVSDAIREPIGRFAARMAP